MDGGGGGKLPSGEGGVPPPMPPGGGPTGGGGGSSGGGEPAAEEVGGPAAPPPVYDEFLDFFEGEEAEEEDFGDVDELPDFANNRAREIHQSIQKKTSLADALRGQVTETKERLSVMQEHWKNVLQEAGHTQELVNAKRREIETEEHLTQLVVREAGRYQQEFRRLEDGNQICDDRLSLAQNSIFKGNEQMDQFKVEMNWNQEELEQWALAAKQKEEDNLALQKYTRADEVKIKELSLLIEKLTKEVVDAKAKLENETTETQARQIELDRTAEEFRSLHAERQRLVRQWQDTIEAMHRRDVTIQELATQYAEEKYKQAEQVENLQHQREHLKGIVDDNLEVETRTGLVERQVQHSREQLLEAQARLQEFTDELDVLKHELAASAAALMKKRNVAAGAAKVLEEKKVLLEEARKKYHQVKKVLAEEVKALQSTELSAKDAELRLADEDAKLKKQEFAMQQLKEQMFRQSQQLFSCRQEEANYIAEISGAQATAKTLQSKIRSLDKESIRQQELIYTAEFQIQQMERKVSRGLGERSDEEKKKLHQEIAELEVQLAAVREQKKMLVAQCRKLNNELRTAIRRKELVQAQRKEFESRIAELEVETVSQQQALETRVKEKEDKMVQHDVMKLEVKRLRDTLNTKADRVFSLENRKQQLQLSMEERKQEIAVHQDVQRAQLKVAEEERHKVALELGARRQAVEKLRGKYETICKTSKVRGEEDDGQPKSQAYYLIQAAQRREELQRKGDELDDEIRKDEKDIRKLSKALADLAQRNTKYRVAHQRAEVTQEDHERMRQMQEQAKVANEALFKRKKELQRLRTDLEEDTHRLEQVQQQASRLEDRNSHLRSAAEQMSAELDAQKENVAKVDTRIQKLAQVHREKLGASSDERTVQELDFHAEGTLDTVQNVLYTLGQLGNEYPEIKEALSTMLRDQGLAIPDHPASVTDGGEESRPGAILAGGDAGGGF
uniref:Coiled-coil domain-containing protein 39 n=1 Tax=Rhizochromulina marina TaxID=1034831 RepID=A0A7S2SB82_9STRA